MQICGTRLSPTPRTPSTFASAHGLPTPSPPQQVQWPQLFGRALPPQVTTQASVFNSNLVPAQRPPTSTGLGSKRQATTRRTTSTTSRQLTTTGRKWSQSTQTSPGRGRPVVGEYEAPPSPPTRAPPTFPFSHSHPHTARTQALSNSRGHAGFLQAELQAALPGVETTVWEREEISVEAPTTRRPAQPWWVAGLQCSGVLRQEQPRLPPHPLEQSTPGKSFTSRPNRRP